MWDQLFTNARLATMAGGAPYGLIESGAIGVKDGVIAFAGRAVDLPANAQPKETVDLGGALVTPGLIDCHTHLVYAGDRASEFEARLLGKSYEEIAKAGGGIISTVRATRSASMDELAQAALPRLDALIAEGVTTVEIKSGYGLSVEHELKMLRAARALESLRPVRIKTSLLAAHALPPEFAGRADDYISLICDEIMPAAHAEGLADAVDGFCEGVGFSPAQIERVFQKAENLGLRVKLHAEQLSDLGGAKLAARYGALSADHLEYLNAEDVSALAKAGTVAVLLPGAFYYLRETKLPPIEALRSARVSMALATDCNPGTSPMTSLLLAMNMGCTLFRLTPEEALAGVTQSAAKALGVHDCGTLEAGKRADFCVWGADHPAALAYGIGINPLQVRHFAG
ncbi:imidazolonepropionase [Hyphococcus sp.]|uniref:imidazolonepropionase n=1 Tax=Hyphococcus sp. TaxID=2038636 RepID=UPI00208CB990|nr:MAG: imidazolonepropionase [Marinicaulis sp.]